MDIKQKNKKIIYKICSYLVILTIFYFLCKNLFYNWQKIENYDFSFNYFYLIISFVILVLSIISLFLIWNRILRILEPVKKLSNFKAIQVSIYSWFGRYLPGKAWMFLGRIYLCQKQGLSKKILTISVIYEIILSVASAFLFALIFLGISFGMKLSQFYFIPLIAILAGFILVHPNLFYLIFNFILRKFNKPEVPQTNFLSYRRIIEIVSYYFLAHFLNGVAFFFLIKSIANLTFYDIMWIIGVFILAATLGMVAVFAPSGLGVREGVLVLFLQLCFPLSIAVFISLIARIWATLGEIIIFIGIYLYSKFKKI